MGVLLRFAGVRRASGELLRTKLDSGAVCERVARSGGFSMVDAEFTAGSFSGCYWKLLSRPENDAIARNSSRLADEL